MTIEEFMLFRKLIYDECGIDYQEDKRTLLDRRVHKRMSESGFSSFQDYYKFLKKGLVGAQELIVLMDQLTINETTFFRNKPQFELLANVVLPEILNRKKRDGERRIRIWSAGCSSGQEPYSIAMTVLETIPFIDLWDVKILASDLSLRMLELAQNGVYTLQQVREVDEETINKYFNRVPEGVQIKDRVKRLVTYDYHNLKNDNGLRGFDIVFCRNVMIYFDAMGCSQLVERFANSLQLGGYIFVGHAESLKGLSNRFKMIIDHMGIAYRRDI